MKSIAYLFLMILSTQVFSQSSQSNLSSTSPLEYKSIYRQILLQDERMIAGKFDSRRKQKLSYRETLREKLKQAPAFYSF